MKQTTGAPGGSDDPTLQDEKKPLPRHTPVQCMALVQGSAPHLSEEIHALLRRRLRIACTICAAAFASAPVRYLLQTEQSSARDPFSRALQLTLLAILVALAALLWTRYVFSHRTLRILELVMFGSMAIYFADAQFRGNDPDRHLSLVSENGSARM